MIPTSATVSVSSCLRQLTRTMRGAGFSEDAIAEFQKAFLVTHGVEIPAEFCDKTKPRKKQTEVDGCKNAALQIVVLNGTVATSYVGRVLEERGWSPATIRRAKDSLKNDGKIRYRQKNRVWYIERT